MKETGNGEAAVEVEGEGERQRDRKRVVTYTVNEIPPWHLLVLLGFQQFLTAFGATFSYPLILQRALCLEGDVVGLSHVISTVIFVAGLSTLIQSTLGIRLPIIQSASYSYLTPFFTLLALPQWKCPYPYTDSLAMSNLTNSSLPALGSSGHQELWQSSLREVQGAIMISALLQILVGYTGLIGVLMRFIGPLTIAPTIALIGLSLFDAAADKASSQWWLAVTTVVLIAIFSQYLGRLALPCCSYTRSQGCQRSPLPLFSLFPVLLAILLAWALCAILTATDTLPSDPNAWGHKGRTDTVAFVLQEAPWFRFPYPGQWGVPTVSLASCLGAMAAALASMVESVGDYYACARLAGAQPPPRSAVNRGIGTEGVTCLLAGAWGSPGGTTSYSENIGAIGITKVGSRLVVQTAGLLMLVLGCLGKFSALFVTIPDPLVGGMFIVMFGMVTAVGISNLQFVDLNSPRNLFVFGLSFFMGLCLPKWLSQPANAGAINTGNAVADQVLTVLCGTSMFVGGALACLLDNTIPGTAEERGLVALHQQGEGEGERDPTYHLPGCQPALDRVSCLRYVPFCPRFVGCSCRSRDKEDPAGQENPAFTTSL